MIEAPPEQARLTVEIKNVQPVEMDDLIASYRGMADEYKWFAGSRGNGFVPDEIKLYVQGIRTGSIITDIVPLVAVSAPAMIQMMGNGNQMVATTKEFIGHLKSAYDFLLGRGPAPEIEPVPPTIPLLPYSKSNYQNLSNIVEPVAKDNGSQINIQGDATFNINITSEMANAIQNSARRHIEALREPLVGFHDKVVLYWYQARNDPRSDKGDRGIIESLWPNPVKVEFANQTIKSGLLQDSDNPFQFGYLVDVSVETVQGRPVVYKVLQLHSKVEIPAA